MIKEQNVIMKPYSNMKIGGVAKSLTFIENENELVDFFDKNERYYLLGNGTNTLINDEYLDINFVSLKKLNKIEKLSENRIYVQSGADLSDLISFMKENDLSGLENITGIPGSIGGLVNMNGGAFGTTIFDKIESVKIFMTDKNEIKVFEKKEIEHRYRGTAIKDNKWIVIGATFIFDKGFDSEVSQDKINKRKQNHPLDFPNLGSTFKNPVGKFAAQLISDCDLKGYRIGDMQVSEKHPNFLINHGAGTFKDVLSLIEYIKQIVFNKTGIMLDTEIIIIK